MPKLIRSAKDRFGTFSGPVQGAFYMIVACLGFSIMNIFVRLGAAELHPIQVAFFRNLFALIFMLPWLASHWSTALKTRRFGLHATRAGFGLCAMLFWFTSVAMLPLAEAVALNFTVPLFATIGAALILRERVRLRRWSATLVGFIGVLIILRPGFMELTPLMSLPVIAAAFMAISVICVKRLSDTETPAAVVLYMNLLLTPLSLLPALFVWRWPSFEVWMLMVALGFFAVVAHIFITRAYASADASAILPFDYSRLPFIAVLAYFFFGQTSDVWTWVGAAVIAASSLYIARREARASAEGRAKGAATVSPRGR